ncbi:MAG: polyprenyl synthetase family protein [Peptococcaceae bacterium]|nr:polyprenyl synthetase family protein [Peptococcaceae bacterium]
MKQLWFFNQINNDLKRVEQELEKFILTDSPILRESAVHLFAAGGKRLRPAFTLLAGRFYDYKKEKLFPVAIALELIHMATLVHDDVVDASMMRRGWPTVKAKWGNIVSIQTGNYLLAKSLKMISQINHPEVSRILAEVSVEMCRGEIQQIRTSYDMRQNLKQYYYRIKRKTAMLINASCRLGAIVTGASKRQIWALGAYGHALGMAFQIVDDVLDVTAEVQELGKPVGSDLRHGIMTLPVIVALERLPQRKILEDIIVKKDKTEADIAQAIHLMIETGAVKESMYWADLYIKKAKKYMEEMPNVPARKALIDLAEFVGARKF